MGLDQYVSWKANIAITALIFTGMLFFSNLATAIVTAIAVFTLWCCLDIADGLKLWWVMGIVAVSCFFTSIWFLFKLDVLNTLLWGTAGVLMALKTRRMLNDA